MTEHADVIVIGLGAVGSASLHRLAKRGVRVIGIDRFHPPHDRGSTHGETRITRLGVGEGAAYAGLVRRSHEIWRELEQETGETLFCQNGGLVMGPGDGVTNHHGQGDFIRNSVAVAEQHGVAHEVLDAAEIMRRFPQFALRGDERGYFEPSAGYLLPERCVDVQLRLARALGATLRTGETVQSIRSLGDGAEVVTDKGRYQAGRVILAAGAWTLGLAGPSLAAHAKVYRQTIHWFELEDPAAYAPERFPIFIWVHGPAPEDMFYGFPALPGSTSMKLGDEYYESAVDPDAVDREVTTTESAAVHAKHVSARLHGVTATCHQAKTCLYTVTSDAGFLVDTLAEIPAVLLASACSGHGFKHSAGLGEALAAAVTEEATIDLESFTLGRFAPAG